MGLDVVYVPAKGDVIAHALTNVAAAETAPIGGTRPATPTELRAHLVEALTADLERAPADRRFWPLLDGRLRGPNGSAPTDEVRRGPLHALTARPRGFTVVSVFTLAAAAAVLGLRITVVLPDGASDVFGPESGRPVVLVRFSAPGPHTGRWAATEPVTASDSSPPVQVTPTRVPPVQALPVHVPPLEIPPMDVPPVDVSALESSPEDMPPVDVSPVEVSPEDVPLVRLPPVRVPPVDVPPVRSSQPPRSSQPEPSTVPERQRPAGRPVANLGVDPFDRP
jgi:hypothetical protein